MTDPIKTTCPYCGVGCGVMVTKTPEGTYDVQGDPDHPANFGKLCSKGSALGETLSLDGRLLHPKIHGQDVDWETALYKVANGFKNTIEKYGPDSVAFYVSGQLLSEDYYVANKLIKGFIGTANIDTNSRLCMSSSVAGHKRTFGSDTVPQTYEDLEKADLVVLTGSNLAWCHPVLYQRLKKAREQRGTKVVVIDPRVTATCDIADLHLALEPGSDVMLFNGLLTYLFDNAALNEKFVFDHTQGSTKALTQALDEAHDYRHVAQVCGLKLSDLMTFYDWFLKTQKTVTVYSQGVNQSSQGTEKVHAILNCHLLTGRIGQEGCGPLSVTGQPNAMGGREVGGLANMLAAHMDFTDEAKKRVQTFWQAPSLAQAPGLKAIDMFNAVQEGKIKAIWIMATNPVVSMPDVENVRAALKKCELVVVSDCMEKTDTMAYAHVALPAATWGERNGTVTNTERCISRQRPFHDLPGEALPDWQIMTKVAQRMGFANAFPYQSSYDVFKEHVALSAYENDGTRDFDLSGWQGLSREAFDQIVPQQWPVGDHARERFFADGRFYTLSGKAQFHAVCHKDLAPKLSDQFPLVLNSGRVRDHWHTMTRTQLSARLSRHLYEPYLDMHPRLAVKEGLAQGDLVKVISDHGEAIVRLNLSEDVKPDHVYMPMHWSDENTKKGVVGRLVNPLVDPFSGQPESKHTPVRVEKFNPAWHGLLLSKTEIKTDGFAYWTRSLAGGCYVYDLAGQEQPQDWQERFATLCGSGESLFMEDRKRGHYRLALIENDLPKAVFIAAQDRKTVPSRQWLCELFEQSCMNPQDRLSLLSARPSGGLQEKGDIVCSCFNVGFLEIVRALSHEKAKTVEEIGTLLKAGTNCGSCQSEIKTILSNAEEMPEASKVA